jgi:multifunctional methyltransferase subunit TRM112
MGITTLPPILSDELASNKEFLAALFHIFMNVHLVEGTLTCPVTGRQFPVQNEIPNMVIEDGECERIN